MAVSDEIRLKIAKKITIKPAVLKKIPDCRDFENFVEMKLIRASIGNVPKAKTSMVRAPLKKLPVVRE